MKASSGSGLCPILTVCIVGSREQARDARAHPGGRARGVRPQRLPQGARGRHRARLGDVEGRRLPPLPEQAGGVPRARGRLRRAPGPRRRRGDRRAPGRAARGGALARVQGALMAALDTFAGNERLARLILLEAASLGPVYQAKRAEVAGRFAALIRGYLDEAVADGSIPPLDTAVATLAWLGAVNEIVIQWLHGDVPHLGASLPALTRLLLRSIGTPAAPDAPPG